MPELHAGVVEEVAAREVVGTVDDHVVAGDDVDDVRRIQPRVVGDDVHVGVQHRQGLLGRVDLAVADAVDVVQDLALQVRRVDLVHVDDADGSDTGRSEIERGGRPEPTGAEHEHLGLEQLDLAGGSHLGQQEVSLVAVVLLRRQRGGLLPRAPLVLPAAEAALHRLDIGEAELGERHGGEGRPDTTGAVDDDGRVLVGDAILDLCLEVPARDVDGAGNRALLVLVGFTDVEHDRAGSDVRRGTLGIDLADLGFRSGEQVTERCHPERLPSRSGFEHRANRYFDATGSVASRRSRNLVSGAGSSAGRSPQS